MQLLTRVYYSSYHLWAAKKFAQKAADIEAEPGINLASGIEHRAYVTNAIFSAVAF